MAEMDQRQLLAFIQRVCKYSDNRYATETRLEQLQTIMQEQQVNQSLISLLGETLRSIPEVTEYSKNADQLSKADLETAFRRAAERRRREAAARNNGRC